ncbi:hypothetical protein GUJ93_ZPchr0016g2621 [Zizania palustris]|uniref:Pyruvate kinase barrel domain-containing protein n=1 Tax=Zizania palustris TaxID=103762 RepID=A0A8J5TDI8_ZIZPA|nr:hypothetical protein GUJ93_ZPchr0016g2621 [Zizania palustris]
MATAAAHSLLHLPAPKPAAPAHLAPSTLGLPGRRPGRLAARCSSGNGDLTAFPNPNGILVAASAAPSSSSPIDVDVATEADLRENGFRSTRRTKLVCTVGPATCGPEELEALAVGGMNVARVNMCHGDREWHRGVIRAVRRLNEEKGFAVAVMMDTEGSEIHMGDLGGASAAKAEVRCLGIPCCYFASIFMHSMEFADWTVERSAAWCYYVGGMHSTKKCMLYSALQS